MDYQKECVLQIIAKLKDKAGAPCKKKLQKIVYLIEEYGVDLGYDYKIHIYGPYCADLDYTICELKTEQKLDITYCNKGHILECCDNNVGYDKLGQDIEHVIDIFGKKTAVQLELITTALFAQRHIENKDDNSIINAVKKIKGNKFSDEKINNAIQLLNATGYIKR